MSRYEDIEEAKKEIAEAEKYLLSLSDKDYAALHVAMQVENLEKEIERKKEELLELQAQSDRKSTRLNSSHIPLSRMPSSA